MREEKKYEVLPGVELPDMKAIKDAASDFTVSGVEDLNIKAFQPRYTPDGKPADIATAQELAALQQLGDTVAADEERAAAESRRRMDIIMHSAVKSPESISELISTNKDKMDESVRKKVEAELKEEEDRKAAEAQKVKAREERRQLQQQLLKEARDRAQSEREAEKKGMRPKFDEEGHLIAVIDADGVEHVINDTSVPDNKKQNEEASEAKPAAQEVPAAPEERQESIATAEETFDDFSEFLDE